MENFKPELKPKQESSECKKLRRKLFDDFNSDTLGKFSSELQKKGAELAEKLAQLCADANNGVGGDLFEKLKALDQENETIAYRAQIKKEKLALSKKMTQEELQKLKDLKRMRVQKDKQKADKKKAKTTAPEQQPEPNKTQADDENAGNTENAKPEESVDAKKPEEADPKKTKAEQKNQFDQKKDNGDDEAEEFFRKNAETRVLVIEILKMIDELPISEEWIPFKKKSELYAKQGELYTRIMDIFDKYDFAKKNPSSSNIEDAKKAIDGMATLRLEVESFRKELQAWKKNTDKEAEDELNSETEVGSEENNQEQDATPEPEPEQNTTQEDSKNNTKRSKYFKAYEKPEQLKKVLEGEHGKGYQFDDEGSSFEIDTCSIEDDTVTLNVRFKGRPYVGTNCDSATMSVDDFESLMLGWKQGGKLKGLLKYVPINGDEDFIAFGKNSEQKPEQASEFQAIRKKYHRLLAKIHVDLFPVGKYNQEVRDRSNDLTKEITNAFANLKKAWKNKYEAEKSNTLTGVIESAWTNSLNKFNELEIEVDEFLKNISKKAEAEAEAKKTEPEPEQQPEPEPEPEPAFKMGEADAETETETETEQENQEAEPEPEEESETNPEPEENEELEILKKAVEQARDQFVRINTEVTSAYLKIKRTLGKIFSKDPGEVPDVKNSYLAYQEKVKELKNFKLDAIKDKYAGISASSEEEKIIKTAELKKELGDLMLEFNFEEKINLYNARTTAGAEVRKDQLGGKALAKSAEWVNRYRKLNWKYKLAISAVLLAGGYAAAMVGATGVGAGILAVNIGRRVVGGAAAGMGTAGLLETIARGSQKKQADKDTATMFGELDEMDKNNELAGLVDEDANWEEKFFAVENALNKKINEYEQSLKREKGSAELRLLAGLSVGVFVGSGAAGQVFKYFYGVAKDVSGYGMEIMKKACGNWEEKVVAVLGVTDPLNDLHESSVAGVEVEKPDMAKTNLRVGPLKPDANATDFKMPDNKIPTEKLIPGSIDEMVDGVEVGAKIPEFEVEISENSNIERELIKRMQELKIPKAEAGKYAHRMVEKLITESKELAGLDPTGKIKPFTLNELNKVKIGEMIKFNIDPNNLDNSSISNFRHINIPHTEGIAVDDIKMSAISEQMNQEEISRKFNDQLFGKAKTIDINPENMPDPRGGLMPDTSISDFSELDSHMDKFPDNMSDTSSANLENIESNLADGARGADNSVADFSLQDNHIDNVADIQGIEISLAEKVNIEKIAGIFDSSLFSGNSLSQQIMETKNLKGVDFYRAYREIYTKIINNTFSENGIIGQDANEYLERSSNSKIDALIKYNSDHFGTQSVEPKSGENMGAWMTRMVDRALGSCGIGLNNGQIKV